MKIEMGWSGSRSAVAFRCETRRAKYASGVVAICAREGKAAKWQCDMWEKGGGRAWGWGAAWEDGVSQGLTLC